LQLTDAAGEFVNPRWSLDGTKNHVRTSAWRHEPGDFSRAEVAACCQSSAHFEVQTF
jgi:hypothetical protein